MLLENARYFDLGPDDVAAAVKSIALTIAAEWRGLANDAGMTRRERDAFEDAFVHDESKDALALPG